MHIHVLGTIACGLAIVVEAGPTRPRTYKAIADIYDDFFGPKETWHPIKATDLTLSDTNTTFDGLPASDAIIVGYAPPSLSPEQQQLFDAAVAAFMDETPSVHARDITECYGVTRPQLSRYQLMRGRLSACSEAGNALRQSGSIWSLRKNYWQAEDGSWHHFTRPDGSWCDVFYAVQSYRSPQDAKNFDVNDCSGTAWALINSCSDAAGNSRGGTNTGPKYHLVITG